MIQSIKCKETEKIFNGRFSKKLPQSIQRLAARKLTLLDAAGELKDLRVPPSTRLETLSGERAGRYSIRIIDRWRICFVWHESNAFEVEIVDYH
jgi:proteic killer suppression protein